MRYTLKAGCAAFRLLNGSHAGAVFEHGKVYDSVPKEQAYMFNMVEHPAPAEPAAEAGVADAAPELPHGNPHGQPPANGVRRRRRAANVAGGE